MGRMSGAHLGKASQYSWPEGVAHEPIAVIGIGCRVAGDITGPAALWSFLVEGRSRVTEVPAERWEPYLRRDPRNAAVLRDITRLGTFLDDLPGFDAEFFGVSPREAELMDPQQRLALEVSWEALEHAGVVPQTLAGTDTAVLMGVNSDDYGKLLMEDLPGIDAWTGIGTSLCGIANRVSHLLDLRGPSVALDAACAASLVAVHQACQLLRCGETSLALAGGVSALIGPGLTRVLDEAGATAPDGRCKTFDAAADGYGRGEGAGVVVLKRLADATRDGDRVLAVIRGGAVAQDGRTVGIMSPNGAAQADMFRVACRFAGVDPATVDYVEAHGTGTPSGDPTEVAALAQVYGAAHTGAQPCRIGSVKPNIGHLEGGAGVLGLIKTVLALHHEVIPPTAGLTRLNPAIDWAASHLRVPVTPEPWPRGSVSRRAAVCSYGYGGTIAHILLEEAPAGAPVVCSSEPGPLVIPVSARSPHRLIHQAEALADHVRSAAVVDLTRIAAACWERRAHEQVRAAVIVDPDSPQELVSGLDTLVRGESAPNLVTATASSEPNRDAVWVFSGHGSHWSGMGQQLLAGDPAFGATIDEIDEVFGAELQFSARAALSSGELGGTDRIQALTFAMQVGLAAVLRDRGVRPAAVIGHSVGEVAAGVVAGAYDLRHGAAIACHRARGFRSVAGAGAMALVRLPFAETEQRLAGRTDIVAAISASTESTVISGPIDAVADITEQWARDGVIVRRVNTDVAFHSPAMDALTADLARGVAALPMPRTPEIPIYTTALADPRSTAARDAPYWVANLRGRVRFAEAITAAAEDGHRLFLEVSAHPVVAHSIIETLLGLGIDEPAAVPVLRRHTPELRAVATTVGWLHCHGATVRTPSGNRAWEPDIPGTQWRHRHFWRTPSTPPAGVGVHDESTHTLLGGRTEITGPAPATMWQTRLNRDSRPYPGEHPVQGTEIVPAAVLLNTFLNAARVAVPADLIGCAGIGLADVHLRTPVAPGRARDVQVVLQDRQLSIASRLADTDGGWLTHTTARITVEGDIPETVDATVNLAATAQRCPDRLPDNHIVDTLAVLGVAAMGFDWRISEIRSGPDDLLAVVTARADASTPTSWAAHIDAATSAASTLSAGPAQLRMPARIDRVRVHGEPCATAHLVVSRRPGSDTVDARICDAAGSVLVSLSGMVFEELENPGADNGAEHLNRIVHRIDWVAVEHDSHAPPSGVLLVGETGPVLAGVLGDLNTAGLPHRMVRDPADITAVLDDGCWPSDLGSDGVILVVPPCTGTPQDSVDLVMRTLRAVSSIGLPARLWVLTRSVHEGSNLVHAPLWGLSRVAAAEHPQYWGGVLDIAPGAIPFGAWRASGHGVLVARDGVSRTARLASVTDAPAAPMQCSAGGTYLITGGTGALGLRMAAWLADLGARRLVLVSRSGLPDRDSWDQNPGAAVRAVTALEERGVSVSVLAVDIGAPGSAEDLRAALRNLPPVRGVIHAAGVEAGVLLADTTVDEMAATMHPKVQGSLVLDEVFPPGELDWMVLFSSCGYLAGFPGQGAYACANSFLDVMARHRRQRGDRTTAVAWTAWRGLGMGSASDYVAAQLDALGMGTVTPDDAVRALDLAMRTEEANIVVLPIFPAASAVPILADISPVDVIVDDVPPAPVVDRQWVSRQVMAAVADQLGLPESGVDPEQPLIELGVDSIMTVRLRRQLEKQTRLSLPPTLLWEHPTAAAVSARITEMLLPEDTAAPADIATAGASR